MSRAVEIETFEINRTKKMDNQELFYQESGQINPIRQSLSYAICIGLALILGYIYSVAIIFIPIVYLNFLITLGFGLTLGLICRAIVRFSHNRSKKSQIVQAVVIGFLANYFQWTAYILYAYNGEIPTLGLYFANLHWIMIPENFFTAVAEINKVGTWSIFGIPFNGFALTAIWIIEFLIIIGGPIVAIVKTKIYPYSELLENWYHKYTLYNDFESISMVNKLTKELASDPVKSIESLGKGSGLRHTKVHLYFMKDEDKQYLTFENIFIEGQGKGKKDSSIVINNFKINKADAELILEKYENKRERIDVI